MSYITPFELKEPYSEMEKPSWNTDALRWRLAETIAWCRRHGPIADAATAAVEFRTPELCPRGFTFSKNAYGRTLVEPTIGSQEPSKLRDIVEEVSVLRVKQLILNNSYPPAPIEHLADGRLLFYDPYENLAEGGEEQETQGYFDLDAVPPWDTWLWFIIEQTRLKNRPHGRRLWYDRYLISWVPSELVDVVDEGVQICSTYCLAWADELDSEFLSRLRESGVIN